MSSRTAAKKGRWICLYREGLKSHLTYSERDRFRGDALPRKDRFLHYATGDVELSVSAIQQLSNSGQAPQRRFILAER
jgi:hypothetical protein